MFLANDFVFLKGFASERSIVEGGIVGVVAHGCGALYEASTSFISLSLQLLQDRVSSSDLLSSPLVSRASKIVRADFFCLDERLHQLPHRLSDLVRVFFF